MNETPELIENIAQIGQTPEGRNTIALSEAEDKTFDFIRQTAQQLFEKYKTDSSEYEIKTDAFGNVFITLFGENRDHVVMSGSHLDSVKNGGNYDGVAGVASALKFLEQQLQSKQKSKISYAVAAFRSEESSPATGIACLGAKIATGTITRDELEKIEYKTLDGMETTLQEHFTKRYGAERWEAVLQELQDPPITPDIVDRFEEVHIEQSGVLESAGADVGIVSGGIGGARRERVQVPPSKIQTEEIDVTQEKPYILFRINILGQADHSGGTPHDPHPFTYHDPKFNIRKDALIASASALYSFLHLKEYTGIHVLRVDIPRATGFTTIPAEQIIEVAVAQDDASAFLKKWSSTKEMLKQENLCDAYLQYSEITPGTKLCCLKKEQVLAAMEIPRRVEIIAECIVAQNANEVDAGSIPSKGLEPDDSYIGEVRATVTDFQLTPKKGLKFNIDERHVDAKQQAQLAKDIYAFIDKTLTEMGVNSKKAHTLISETPFAPIDEESVRVKKRIAESLGYKFVTMPSMPGQDAGVMSKAGIPTSVTFIRHPAISHNKDEFADPNYINKATALSHGFIAHLLDPNHLQAI